MVSLHAPWVSRQLWRSRCMRRRASWLAFPRAAPRCSRETRRRADEVICVVDHRREPCRCGRPYRDGRAEEQPGGRLGHGAHARRGDCLYPHVYKSLSYNPQQDFTPVTTINTTAMTVCGWPDGPSFVKTLADFIAWCKGNPSQSSYGSPGAGSPLHFLGVLLSAPRTLSISMFRFRERRPPSKACWAARSPPASRRSAPSFRMSGPGRFGRWRQRAHSAARCSLTCQPLPRRDIRRSRSSNGSVFLFLRGRRRHRRDAQRRLRAGLQAKEMQAGLAAQSVDAGGLTPADFVRQVKADYDRWGPIVKESGFTPLD